MQDFLKFFQEKVKYFPLHLSITYNKVSDWHISIWKNGCAEDYPGCETSGNDAVVCSVQDTDLELCFAKAHVAFKNWLSVHVGGY